MLHQITPIERLLAQGEYKYQVSGKDSGLSERWSLHILPGGEMVHRADVGGFIAGFRLKQISHFLAAPDYKPATLEMTQQIRDDMTSTLIRCAQTSIEQSITRQAEADKRVLEVPAGYALFFPPVSAQGFIVRRYNLDEGGRQSLPLVSVRIQPEDGLPLSVEIQAIEYEHLNSHEEIETLAGQFTCHHFIRYDQHMEQHLWLDQNWIPIQWSVPYSPIMKWEYLLTRYQRGDR
jgi:hypothetical protein